MGSIGLDTNSPISDSRENTLDFDGPWDFESISLTDIFVKEDEKYGAGYKFHSIFFFFFLGWTLALFTFFCLLRIISFSHCPQLLSTSSNLPFVLPISLFSSRFPFSTLFDTLVWFVRSTCPNHLSLLHFFRCLRAT